MTTTKGNEEPLTVTVAWPENANADARVCNMHVYQWDADHTGMYLLLGHVGVPIWLAPDDRQRWEQAHPDNRIPVEPLGAFYMTKKVARDFCEAFARHLGLIVVEGPSGAPG